MSYEFWHVTEAQHPVCNCGRNYTPHKCPVCDGRGTVPPPAGGYNNTAEVTCNACKGAGVLWR